MWLAVYQTAASTNSAIRSLSINQYQLIDSEFVKKARFIEKRAFEFKPGNVLLSHTVSHAVPSTMTGLTAVFGMGTGVTPSLSPPRYL